jgi:hypothetical protein
MHGRERYEIMRNGAKWTNYNCMRGMKWNGLDRRTLHEAYLTRAVTNSTDAVGLLRAAQRSGSGRGVGVGVGVMDRTGGTDLMIGSKANGIHYITSQRVA